MYKPHPWISRTPNLEAQILEKEIKTIQFEVPVKLYTARHGFKRVHRHIEVVAIFHIHQVLTK